jgi:hypothetical protein
MNRRRRNFWKRIHHPKISMPPGGRNSPQRMYCATKTVRHPNVCFRPSGSIKGCGATSLKPLTENRSACFIQDSSASKAARILATRFCRLMTRRRVPATWKLICVPPAGAPMATTKIKIFRTSSSTSSGKATEPRTSARPQPRPGPAADFGLAPFTRCDAGRVKFVARKRACAFAAGKFAWQMLRAVARTRTGAIDGTVARGGACPFSIQGRTNSRPRKKRWLGANFVGKSVPRPRLQAQRVADAKSGGDKTVLVARCGFGV